jgi:purine-nucleoside/S-methyl-5'-thioadenosine phosphorylase / adenosine deaminase
MMAMADPQPTGAFEWTQEPWGSALRCTALPARHLFTSRDLTLRHDDREWTAVAASVGVPRARLLLITQVHGNLIALARRGDTSGWQRPKADAIVTDDPSVAVGVRVADCAPLLLFDPVRNVVAAVHAGWRGTSIAVSLSAARAMTLPAFGCRASDIIAAIGPCLGPCCGEVGPEVREAFRANGASDDRLDQWFTPGVGDRLFLDLERANRDQLEDAGLDPARVFTSGLCTKTHHERFHSFRAAREGAGRMVAAIRPAEPV